MIIQEATTDAHIISAWPVMRQLRPHLDEATFLARVRRQQTTGYRLIVLEDDDGRVQAVAGIRILDQLVRGRNLYVDDLVTDETARSRGFGDTLFDWLVNHARADGCGSIELDSGVQRHGAHRFYLRKRMDITAYHFVMPIA